jgi:hypothetical protein
VERKIRWAYERIYETE